MKFAVDTPFPWLVPALTATHWKSWGLCMFINWLKRTTLSLLDTSTLLQIHFQIRTENILDFTTLKTSLRRIAGASQTLSTTWHVPHPLILIFYICFSMLFHKVSAVSEVVNENIRIHLFIEWSCFKHFYNAKFCFYIWIGLGTVS